MIDLNKLAGAIAVHMTQATGPEVNEGSLIG
jgi:hypothetical protein